MARWLSTLNRLLPIQLINITQYYHRSELPKIIKGNFAEFKEMKGEIYERTGLPQGMIEDTNPSNFQTYRGGYNCGHQAYPIPASLVPKNIIATFANK
jgi:hypothetical protein